MEQTNSTLAIWLSITGHGAEATRRPHPFDRQMYLAICCIVQISVLNFEVRAAAALLLSAGGEMVSEAEGVVGWAVRVVSLFISLLWKKNGERTRVKRLCKDSCLVFLGTPSNSSLCLCLTLFVPPEQLMHSLVSANFCQFRRIDLYSFQEYFFNNTHAYAQCIGWVMGGFNSLFTPCRPWSVFDCSLAQVSSFVFHRHCCFTELQQRECWEHAHHATTRFKGSRFGTTPQHLPSWTVSFEYRATGWKLWIWPATYMVQVCLLS